jgi:hypothetical protein
MLALLENELLVVTCNVRVEIEQALADCMEVLSRTARSEEARIVCAREQRRARRAPAVSTAPNIGRPCPLCADRDE